MVHTGEGALSCREAKIEGENEFFEYKKQFSDEWVVKRRAL